MKRNEIKRQNRTKTTTVKNPNWPEANQLAIYKCSWEVEPGTTKNKFNQWSELVLNPESPDLKASALTTGPHCLLQETLPENTYMDNLMKTGHACNIHPNWVDSSLDLTIRLG